MISDELARALQAAGVRWDPRSGDRFKIAKEALTEQVFTVSDMVIEEHRHEQGNYLGFNGTTEWALDSVPTADTLWLPREDQLRDLLGTAFVSLERREQEYAVTAQVHGYGAEEHAPIVGTAATAADAYARALLDLVVLSIA